MFTTRSLTVRDDNSVRINWVFALRSLTVVVEIFAATALVVWIAAGCVILAINGAPP
ncbi:MAG: hypothetical protein WA571_07350 [Candidatus Binatus sp.]